MPTRWSSSTSPSCARRWRTAETAAEIVTRGRGYELRLGNGGLDAHRFEQLITARDAARGAGAVARRAAGRRRGRAVRGRRDPPPGGAAPAGDRAGRGQPTWRAAGTGRSSGRSRRSRPRSRCESACTPSGCSPSIAPAGRPTRSRPTATSAERSWRRSARSRVRSCATCTRRSCARTPSSSRPATTPPGCPRSWTSAPRWWAVRRSSTRCASTGGMRTAAPAGSSLVVGERGIGKTRLAAELAAELHRDRATVLYASGAGAPETARAVLASARAARRPTLVVIDDVDRAGDERPRPARRARRTAAGPPGARRRRHRAGAPVVRADATLTLAPLDADGVAADRAVVCGRSRGRRGAGRAAGRGERRRAAARSTAPRASGRARSREAPGRRRRPCGVRAGRAARGRGRPRGHRRRAAGGARARRSAGGGADGVVVCPFKGLASFDVDDAEFFFGRERLVAEMVARLAGAPLMGIVGPSGSGKSSALRAGLLPALAEGVLPGSEGWALALLRPGEHPRARARATRSPPPARPGGSSSRSTSSRRSSPPAATRPSASRSSTRWWPARATLAAARSSWSPSARTSTAAARATPSCGACWAPTRSRSGRCGATSCAARSSCPPAGRASRSSRS